MLRRNRVTPKTIANQNGNQIQKCLSFLTAVCIFCWLNLSGTIGVFDPSFNRALKRIFPKYFNVTFNTYLNLNFAPNKHSQRETWKLQLHVTLICDSHAILTNLILQPTLPWSELQGLWWPFYSGRTKKSDQHKQENFIHHPCHLEP